MGTENDSLVAIDDYAAAAADALEQVARMGWGAGDEAVSEGLYRIIRDLAAGSRYLIEITEHLSKALAARAHLEQLRLDANGEARYPTPGAAIATAQIALAEATSDARSLARHLDEAQQVTSTIADTGNLAPDLGPCGRCGHDHHDHDGDDATGSCCWWDYDTDASCDCRSYQPVMAK